MKFAELIKSHSWLSVECILLTLYKYSHSADPKLSDWQKERINVAENQISKGDYLTNQQANELFDKWLNE